MKSNRMMWLLAIPLDNLGGGTHKIVTFYRDKDETTLLNDLKETIK